MTLLESIVAFVLLAVVGVACLDQSRGALQLQASSAAWDRAITRGESALAQAVAGTEARDGDSVRVERRPWRNGVDVITVTVALPTGASYELSRLVPSVTVARYGAQVRSGPAGSSAGTRE